MKKSIIIGAALAGLLMSGSSYAIDISVSVGVGNARISASSYHSRPYYVDRVRHVHRHSAHCGHFKPRHHYRNHRNRHYRPRHGYYEQRRYHQPRRYYREPSGVVYYRSKNHDRYSVKQYRGGGVYKGKTIRYLPNGTVIEKRRYYRY
ncbi:hypothetical protein [Spartinivicinus poritis]|uniref:Uncharacterized protein n=1 Tax=Spartinivicinus poritis TaxID=2994640 RepID=A0ABT5UBS8_9GAMM|nr:hypothetical protein [Spartinivicinus sp. A2-2]MDE1463834.1 hypothetical protein [Spartinivicinus sp. A2-2]